MEPYNERTRRSVPVAYSQTTLTYETSRDSPIFQQFFYKIFPDTHRFMPARSDRDVISLIPAFSIILATASP